MNQIVLRGKPAKRLLFVVLLAAVMAICLPPAFVQIDCVADMKCWIYKLAGPYLGVLFPIFCVIPARRFLLGKPALTLTRDGIDAGLHPMGMIPWAHIENIEIKHVHFAERLVIRRRADTVPPPRSFLERMFYAGFGARTHLYVSQMHIDRTLHHLKHWVDEGVRNAVAGKSPDPFFTVPY